MNVIEAARNLGKILQQDEVYIAYAKALLESEKDEELQNKIGNFNITKMNLDSELSKDEKDEEKVKELNTALRSAYDEIMSNPKMVAFNEAKGAVDTMLSQINTIIMMSVQGADPETCEINSCAGDCSSCGGCH